MKVLISKTTTEGTEHSYPIYCYWQCDDSISNYYARITENSWTEIHFKWDGEVYYKEKSHNAVHSVPKWMLRNITDKQEWDLAVKDFKASNIFEQL